MSMYYGLKEKVKLKEGQLVLARCPNWCDEGYQIATYNGSEFEYSSDPNGSFNEYIIAFMPLDEDGCPLSINQC